MNEVLVVHPDGGFAAGVVAALADVGIAATSVPDGERAIDRFVQFPASALVVDVTLPGRDGAATVESIRWAPGGARIPVVLTCTTDGGEHRLTETGRRLGVTTMTAAGERDPQVVAAAVRRALAAHAPTAAASPAAGEARTAERPLPTPQATTSEARLPDAGLEDEDSLPPARVLPKITRKDPSEGGASRDRATVATRKPRSGDDEDRRSMLPPDAAAHREADDVARAQREITPGAAAMTGDLSDLPFARLLAKLADERATGALVVLGRDDDGRQTTTGEAPKKVVYFRLGVPVYVKSNLVRETLGEILARSSMIDRATHEEAVTHMRAGEGRLGGILLGMGAIKPTDLREALAEQLRTKLFDLFGWDRGQYRFSRRVLPPPEVVTLELGLPEIVFEGLTRKVPPHRLLSLLAPFADSYVIPAPGATERFASLDLVPEARVALRAIDGTRTLRDLGTVAGKRPAAAAQLVYAMECLGAVRFEKEPRQAAPTSRREATGVLAVPVDLATAREELQELMRAVRERRFADALSSPADRAAAETEAARLVARYTPLIEAGIAPRDVRALATEVCVRLSRARDEGALLLNGPALGSAVPHTAAAPAGTATTWEDDTFESTDTGAPKADAYAVGAALLSPTGAVGALPSPPAASARVATPVDAPAPSAPAPSAPVPRTPAEAEADFEQPTPVRSKPSTLPPPPRGRAAARARAASGAMPAPAPAAAPARADLPHDPPTDALDAAALDARVARLADAERHFRRGERALARDRFSDAIAAFEKAVELVPEEGEFLAHLAWAKHRAAPEDEAVRAASVAALVEATRLSPKLARAHLLLGRVLQSAGDLSGAREAYEAAAAAAPDASEALAALRSLA